MNTTDGLRYIDYTYSANAEFVRKMEDLNDVVMIKERSVGTSETMDDERCGVVGKIVSKLVDLVRVGGVDFSGITNAFTEFGDNIKKAFEDAGGFLKKLSPLKELDFISVDFIFLNPNFGKMYLFLVYHWSIHCLWLLHGLWQL